MPGYKIQKVVPLIVWLILAFILTGCGQTEDVVQDVHTQAGAPIYGDHTIGQTFVARRNNLSRVDVLLATYARPQRQPVVFILKESPTSPDELVSVVAPPQTVRDNAFHTFNFPPIPDSAGKVYYFEIQSPTAPENEAITIWYQPDDVYSAGDGYLDREPVAQADVAFRTYHSPNISYLWSRLPAGKPGIWGEPLFYGTLFVLYAGLALALWLALLRLAWPTGSKNQAGPGDEGKQSRGKGWLLLLLLGLALVRGVIYASITYPWQIPDEHGHYEYARLMVEQQRVPTSRDETNSLQQEVLASMSTFDFWRLAGMVPPAEIPVHFDADPYLRFSRPQVGDEPPLYYLLPAASYLFTHKKSVDFQLYVMRFTSVIFIVMTVWFCYLIAQELFRDQRLLAASIPALIVFMPMFIYIGAGINNDIGAAVTASLVFLILVRLYRRGLSWQRVTWLVVALAMALLTKKNNLFLVPLLLMAGIIYGLSRLKWGPWVRYAVRVGAVILGLGLVIIFVLSQIPTGDAWAWQERPRPWMQTQSNTHSRSGDFSFHIRDDSLDWSRMLLQTIPASKIDHLAGQPVTLSVWVRSEAEEQPGMLIISDLETETAITHFVAGPNWTRVSVSHTISAQVGSLNVILVAGNEDHASRSELYFDDAVLSTNSDSSESTTNLLRNESAEISQNFLQALPEYLRIYFRIPAHMVNRLFDPRYYTGPQFQFYYLSLTYVFNSFWARFAQQAFTVSSQWYYLWLAVTLLALSGIVFKIFRSRPLTMDTTRYVLLIFGLALLLIVIQTVLPMIRLTHTWLPQGRYMFAAIIPISLFLTLGIRQLWPDKLKDAGVLVLVMIMGLFDTVALFYYLIPYFYG